MPSLVRQRPADDGVEFDDRRLVPHGFGRPDGREQRVEILLVSGSAVSPVDLLGMPAKRVIPPQDILGEGDVGVPFNGDPVSVIDHDEIAQILSGSQ